MITAQPTASDRDLLRRIEEELRVWEREDDNKLTERGKDVKQASLEMLRFMRPSADGKPPDDRRVSNTHYPCVVVCRIAYTAHTFCYGYPSRTVVGRQRRPSQKVHCWLPLRT